MLCGEQGSERVFCYHTPVCHQQPEPHKPEGDFFNSGHGQGGPSQLHLHVKENLVPI